MNIKKTLSVLGCYFGCLLAIFGQAQTALTPTVTWVQTPDTTLSVDTVRVPNPPKGMIHVPSGFTQIGSLDGLPAEQPPFWVHVQAFFMDEYPVTVAEFREFVTTTRYITDAEKFGNAAIFNLQTADWQLLDSATWHHPLGPNSPTATDTHPVTQVSYNDATAYATWAGKRLPTEMEWEHAARNAQNARTRFPFGDELTSPEGRYLANIWQGDFPVVNRQEDGYLYTSPVGFFGKTPLGLSDMSGNVWQWTANSKFEYSTVSTLGLRATSDEKTMRGGSFMCNQSYCFGYRVSGRSFATPETSLFHVGFRCIQTAN